MAEDTGNLFPFNVSFNTPNRTIITIRATDNEDMIEKLGIASAPVGPDGTTMLEMIAHIDKHIANAAGAPDPSPAGPAAKDGQGSANPPCPTCGGATEYKTGHGKNGKWEAYLCKTAPRGERHEAVWL